ncbi:class I SAM-dependent methyltransferase [Halobacillus sp. Marseille-Q1614]|uniref:tRNA (adenine(22)-N(1))-methyltransferase n=1 Tax=Halobacillus sp. Marseille-Q1614 TaxID=2709134 RepID=UPI0015711D9E|nr:class I SAM-dependent methyltransferase [Halobacillus sp. Marseille-Q1614]
MNGKQLSQRLKKVADFLKDPIFFADIGSDHAYLPCYVCLSNSSAKAIAGELNEGPFLSAQEEVKENQLENAIEVKKGNGLEVIDERVNQVVIAGMGGPLIRDILEEGRHKLENVTRIIAQPNIDARSVRKWFYQNGYQLAAEEILEENGHIYEILVANKEDSKSPYGKDNFEKELWLGPYLMREKNSAFLEKWEEERSKKIRVIEQMKRAKNADQEKARFFEQQIKWIEEELSQ